MSVLTVLRNRVYLGEIFFRGVHHASPHEHLVDDAIFAAAQDLLSERGADNAACRSNSYDYLLTRLLVCALCGKRYVGAAAHGRHARYEYYVCHSRQKYGQSGCAADRLPARELEEAVIEAIGTVFSDLDFVQKAFAVAVERTRRVSSQNDEERHHVEVELKKTEVAIDRYLAAFEDGSMSSAQCGPRIEQLSDRLRALRSRRDELEAIDLERQDEPDQERIATLQGDLAVALSQGEVPAVKAVLKELVDTIEVYDGRRVHPRFRIPGAVRTRSSVAVPTGFEPVSPP